MNEAKAMQIGDTPLSISVYSVENLPAKKNPPGTLQIVLCLKGTVEYSYAYEEFHLRAGEYIAVDTDAYFFRKGRDNLCVSFLIDLTQYKSKHPFIEHEFFVCEGLPQSDVKDYPTIHHERLKGLMLIALKDICEGNLEDIPKITEDIVEVFVNHFDIVFYHNEGQDISDEMVDRIKRINYYLIKHKHEKLTLGSVADHLGITEGYLSEILRKHSIGFSGMLSYMRASESEELLLNSDKNIIDISEECGFSDVKYYYSAFKKWYKCTPRQFRERYGQVEKAEIEYLPVEAVKEQVDILMRKHYCDMFLEDIFEIDKA